jgi:lipopolysaccharide export system protein LptA
MRRRSLELALLVFGGVFLAAVILSFRPGRRPRAGRPAASSVPASREAGEAMTLSSGFDFSESLRGKPLFRIRAKRTVAFGPGAAQALTANLYSGEDVSLTVYPEDGSPLTVHADRAEYDSRTRGATLEGNVRWQDSAGALGETRKLVFHPAERILEAPEAIHLVRGTFDLRARSGVYEVATRTLTLRGPIEGTGTGEGSGGVSSLAAEAGTYRRDEGVIELSGSVQAATREGDRIESDRLLLKLSEEGGKLLWARAAGNVRGVLAPRASGARPAARREYAAREAALFTDESGAVRSLTLDGSPASLREPGRTLRAENVELLFAGGRLVTARARGGVVVETGPDRARGGRAEAAFSAAGELESLELSGNARLDGPERSARAEKAIRVPSRGIWVLTGPPGGSATVEQAGSRVSAARIEIDEPHKTLRADGNARALLAPGKRNGPSAALVADPSRPTRGKADRMVLDDGSRTAVLSGGAALWQDASTLFGDNITLNDAERTIVATGSARAVLAPEAKSSKSEDRRPSILTARQLLYREKEATARFEGGVSAARGAFRASGEAGVAHFGPERGVDRVELTGRVSVIDAATGRTGQAEKATDFPREGRTVLEGRPARVSDREGNRVTGATLTITDRGRSVEVTAPEGGRTETIHKTRPD